MHFIDQVLTRNILRGTVIIRHFPSNRNVSIRFGVSKDYICTKSLNFIFLNRDILILCVIIMKRRNVKMLEYCRFPSFPLQSPGEEEKFVTEISTLSALNNILREAF